MLVVREEAITSGSQGAEAAEAPVPHPRHAEPGGEQTMKPYPDGNVELMVRNVIANVLRYQPAEIIPITEEPKRRSRRIPRRIAESLDALSEEDLAELRKRVGQ